MIYDAVVVGGGVAGASTARALALAGARVVVFEREARFKDRVRADMLYPWGAAELQRLGLYELVLASVATMIRTWTNTIAPLPRSERDFPTTTPNGLPALGFFHPELQELLLAEAEKAGAEVRRGTRVVKVEPGKPVRVGVVNSEGDRSRAVETIAAGLVIGADGRRSGVRSWAGFDTTRDPERLALAGVLFSGSSAPGDSANVFMVPGAGTVAIVIPIGKGRHRVYGGYELRGGRRQLSGPAAVSDFVGLVTAAGAPAAWFDGAERAGPLAEFDGADDWVERPYRDGVVLIGDAAATSDPSFGCGVSLALRDARVLSEALVAAPEVGADWSAAAAGYAEEHDRYYGSLHRQMDWLTQVLRESGPERDSLRRRVLPFFRTDPSRIPDIVGRGPDGPSDEAARKRFFGET